MAPLKEKKKDKTEVKAKTLESMKRRPTLDELLDGGLSIFVLNNTKPRGIVAITFTEPGSNRSLPLLVPVTSLPINVSNRIPIAAVDNSADFRRHLETGLLLLEWPADAAETLKSKEAQEELRDLHASNFSGGFTGGKSRFSADATKSEVMLAEKTAKKHIADFDISVKDEDVEDDDDAKIDARVQGIVTQLNAEPPEITPTKAKRELRAMANLLKPGDWQFVISMTKSNKTEKHDYKANKEVKDFARQQLTQAND
jgi:hypothetical protein